MATTDLALAGPSFLSSPSLAASTSKSKRRSRGRKRNGRVDVPRVETPAFSELERTFFAAAPPDEPAAAPAAERFDDLDEAAPVPPGTWRRAMAAVRGALRRLAGRALSQGSARR